MSSATCWVVSIRMSRQTQIDRWNRIEIMLCGWNGWRVALILSSMRTFSIAYLIGSPNLLAGQLTGRSQIYWWDSRIFLSVRYLNDQPELADLYCVFNQLSSMSHANRHRQRLDATGVWRAPVASRWATTERVARRQEQREAVAAAAAVN